MSTLVETVNASIQAYTTAKHQGAAETFLRTSGALLVRQLLSMAVDREVKLMSKCGKCCNSFL